VRVCVPVKEDQGFASLVCGHLREAPLFLLVDTERGLYRVFRNLQDNHGQGRRNPLAALGGEPVDVLVVGGVGHDAFAQLEAARIVVYSAEHATAAENLSALAEGKLHLASATEGRTHGESDVPDDRERCWHGGCGYG
jgi:predicted Fe-Mo cluster-binding NifX family protein